MWLASGRSMLIQDFKHVPLEIGDHYFGQITLLLRNFFSNFFFGREQLTLLIICSEAY